jgi:4-diphosphocytidyl-2-C-methyl-D-erythritol kinase
VSGFLRIRAHAKVNLALAVGAPIPEGKPRAGMHPIASWMVAIDLADEVEIRAAERATFEIEWASGAPIEWEPRDDLAVRAHAEMERAVGHRLPARIRVRKHIPAGGGLGGGSADAGAVLRGLDAMFKLRLPEPELHAIASRLGSDVPFFVDPGVDVDRPPRPALVTGLGGTIERTPATSGDVTLFFPSFGCPTGAVYAAFDEALSRMTNAPNRADADLAARTDAVSAAARQGGPVCAPDDPRLFNDLAEPAERVVPELGRLRAELASRFDRPVHVSGSGSTVFVLGVPDGIGASTVPGIRSARARLV